MTPSRRIRRTRSCTAAGDRCGLVPPAAGRLATVLVLAVAWGLVNHLGLSLLVALLSGAGGPAGR
jgi:hypothetical protein